MDFWIGLEDGEVGDWIILELVCFAFWHLSRYCIVFFPLDGFPFLSSVGGCHTLSRHNTYSCRRFWYTLWPTQNDGQSTLSSHDCARSCARSENEATLNKIRVCQFFTYRGRVSLFFRLLEKHFNFTCFFFFSANMSKLQFLFVQHKKDMAFGLLSHGCLTYNSLDYCTIVMGLSF